MPARRSTSAPSCPRPSPLGAILAGLFGYRSAPTPLEVIGYLAYLIPVLIVFVKPASRPDRSLAATATLAIAIILLVSACSSAGTSAPPASVPGGAIAVAASEYKFEPATLTAKAGDVTFAVTNAGTTEHEFEIFQGDKTLDEVEGLTPGLTKSLTVALVPGTYTYVCKLAGHDTLGMKGTLTVTAD